MIQFLSKSQVEELTGKLRYHAQVKALKSMGVDHRVRPDGRPMVIEFDVMINLPNVESATQAKLNLSVI